MTCSQSSARSIVEHTVSDMRGENHERFETHHDARRSGRSLVVAQRILPLRQRAAMKSWEPRRPIASLLQPC